MSLEKNTDYRDFLDLLAQQYKSKSNFVSMLGSFADQYNDIETALFEIRDEFFLATASGVQLDIIGEILGLPRDGRDDESYRTLLFLKGELNFSAGTPESLIKAAAGLYNASRVEYVPIYPAKIRLWTNGTIGAYQFFDMSLDTGSDLLLLDDGNPVLLRLPDEVADGILYDIIPAGVGLLLADSLILDDDGFLFLDDGGEMILL